MGTGVGHHSRTGSENHIMRAQDLRRLGVQDGDLLHMDNTVQMHKPVPPARTWNSVVFVHQHWRQRLYWLPTPETGIRERLAKAGYKEPETFILEHGYCRSLYVTDPNGMLVELTADEPSAVQPDKVEHKLATAHAELARWLEGNHKSNNTYR